MVLQLRPKFIIFQNPNFTRLLSSSSSSSSSTPPPSTVFPNNNNNGEDENRKKYSASLKQQQRPSSSSSSSKINSLEESRQNLYQFRSQTAPPLPNQTQSSSSSSITGRSGYFSELYRRKAIEKNGVGVEGCMGGGGTGGNANEGTCETGSGISFMTKIQFDQIRENLRNMKIQNQNLNVGGIIMGNEKKVDPWSFQQFKKYLQTTLWKRLQEMKEIDEKKIQSQGQRVDMITLLQNEDVPSGPPKEHLVEKAKLAKDKQKQKEKSEGMTSEPRMNWTSRMDDHLVNVLKEEHLTSGRNLNGTWKSEALAHAAQEVSKNIGLPVKVDQVRQRTRYLKDKYKKAKEFKEKNGFGWNPNTQLFTADDDSWKEFIEAHPSLKGYRSKAVPYYDDMDIMYGE